MKKKIIFLMILLLVGFTFVNCKGGVEPISVVKTFTVTAFVDGVGGKISPSSVEVAGGSSVKLVALPDSGYVQKTISLNGGIPTPLTSKDYIIPGVASNIIAKVTFEMTPWGMLMSGLWQQSGYMSRNKGETKWNILTPRKVTYTFGDDNRFQSNDSGFSSNGPYKLTLDSLFIGTNSKGEGGFRYKILKLSKDTLEIKAEIKYIGNDNLPNGEVIEKYIH